MRIPPNNKMNTEHIWPQSRFNPQISKSIQKADLHHLIPTDSNANGIRGNNIFGEVPSNTSRSLCNNSRVGKITDLNGKKKWAFEPPDKVKGDVARSVMYFAIRYKMKISDIEEYFLKKWHQEDPVSELEIHRNNEIFNIQNNRNPFIDLPILVEMIKDF